MSKLPDTTPIENVVDMGKFVPEYMAFSGSFGYPRNLVSIHKSKLGKQTTTFQGSEYRMWCWVGSSWVVFVSNLKGICFEVLEGTTEEEAWSAWQEYQGKMRTDTLTDEQVEKSTRQRMIDA